MKVFLAIFLFFAANFAQAETLDVPSGQSVTFVERIEDSTPDGGALWRYRFLAPDITRDRGLIEFEAAQDDMTAICEGFVMTNIATQGASLDQVVITLMDRFVPFGQPMPEATQFIEVYRLEGATCTWEAF